MDTSTLSAKDRQMFEGLLDQFDRALKDCRDGQLPDAEAFLAEYQGKEREYLQREMEALKQDRIRGEYIKLRRIGGGGMGDVFLVRHIALGREFALKEIKLECLQQGARREFESRFKREVEACGRLENHPNIVSVTNTGTSDSGIPYLVMEYIDGEDLKQLVEKNGPQGVGYACTIIRDAAIGLAHAHEKGLVHRDIKPSNLMISKHGVVTVLDLGLARVIESDRQATFVSVPGLVGSFDYMSPEQCREQTDIDSRADVYSLGCTLFFLLAGEPPFVNAKSIFQKLNAHQQGEIPNIDLLADYPELSQIVERMLAKRPDDRYQNLSDVAADLERFTDGIALHSLVKSDTTAIAPEENDAQATTPFPGSKTQVAQNTTVADRRGRIGRRKFFVRAAALATTATAGTAIAYYAWPDATMRGRFIATLPGLNGRWWFEEVPWLLPEVRLLLMERLSETESERLFHLAHAADTPTFYQELMRQVQQTIGASSVATRERFAGLKQLDPEKVGDAINAMMLDESNRILSTDRAQRLAVDQHLLAIIYHHRDDFSAAQTAYQAALSDYAEGSPLRALCLSDWGQMLLKQRKSTVAMIKFQRSREELRTIADDESKSRLFRLHVLCSEADAHRRIPNEDSALRRLRDAKPLADQLVKDHPSRSMFEERCGWYHLGAWHLSEAEANFSQAKASRRANLTDDNFRALHFEYWDRQGKAMVDFYRGNVRRARSEFEAMLHEIKTNRQLQRRQIDELRSREPNLNERLSDTNLVWKLYADDQADQSIKAALALDRAIVSAKREGFDTDGRKTILVRLMYKAALVWTLANDAPQAKRRLEAALEWESKLGAGTTDAGTTEKRTAPSYEVTKQLAQGCYDLTWRDQATAVDESLLPLFSQHPRGILRDDLLVLLVVGQWLLASSKVDEKLKKNLAGSLNTLADVRSRGEAVEPANATSKTTNAELFDKFQDALTPWLGSEAKIGKEAIG